MERGVMLNAVIDRADESRILGDGTVRAGVRDPRQILENDAARADVGMADFGVAHLACGQTDVAPGSADQRVGILIHERMDVFCPVDRDRVPFRFRSVAEAIQNYKCCKFFQNNSAFML